MEWSLETVVFFILLIDSLAANAFIWLGGDKWWKKNFRVFSRYFPPVKGWAVLYLALVLFIGVMIYRAGGFGA